ncbi:MAG TPA: hypothetical protein VN714_14850, partial [Trebonia sp.]|nr:hypothetical protein [Trebonia sp.]
MSSTVTDARHRVSDAKVKNVSGLVERPRRWWQRKAEQQAPAVERSTYPSPGADTEILPAVRPTEPKQLPQVLYRERPADLDKAACNITLAATAARLHGWSAIKLEEQLAVHLRVVHGLAAQERAEAQKLLDRAKRTAGTPEAAVQGIREVVRAQDEANSNDANKLAGVTVTAEVDTGAYGRDLG